VTKVISYCANENHFYIFEKPKDHEAFFAVSVGSPDQVRSVQHEPHICQIHVPRIQSYCALDRIKPKSPNSVEPLLDLGIRHCPIPLNIQVYIQLVKSNDDLAEAYGKAEPCGKRAEAQKNK
jgi:hypothetical protein